MRRGRRPQGDDGSFRIGIAWCDNSSHYPGQDARTTQLAHWLPIARVPGVSLYSLQKDSAASQVQDVPDLQIRDLSKAIDDFADLAAVMSCLDLIITVDSSPAHLAGALAPASLDPFALHPG